MKPRGHNYNGRYEIRCASTDDGVYRALPGFSFDSVEEAVADIAFWNDKLVFIVADRLDNNMPVWYGDHVAAILYSRLYGDDGDDELSSPDAPQEGESLADFLARKNAS